jgi:hypothetical protein
VKAGIGVVRKQGVKSSSEVTTMVNVIRNWNPMGKWVTRSSLVFQKSKIFILWWALKLLIGPSTLCPPKQKKGFPNFDHSQILKISNFEHPPQDIILYTFIKKFTLRCTPIKLRRPYWGHIRRNKNLKKHLTMGLKLRNTLRTRGVSHYGLVILH